jgi:hypothetical protein
MRAEIFHQIFVDFFIVILESYPFVDKGKDFTKECYLFAMAAYSDIIVPDFYQLLRVLINNLKVGKSQYLDLSLESRVFGVFSDGKRTIGNGEVSLREGKLDELNIGLAEMG